MHRVGVKLIVAIGCLYMICYFGHMFFTAEPMPWYTVPSMIAPIVFAFYVGGLRKDGSYRPWF